MRKKRVGVTAEVCNPPSLYAYGHTEEIGSTNQAASVISTSGSALYVTYHPQLAFSPAGFPRGIIAPADSYITSKNAHILARHLEIDTHPRDRVTLREVIHRFGGEPIMGWPPNSADCVTLLSHQALAKHIAKLRPASAQMDGEEGVIMIE
ncbi:hypothetical protein BC826DRAFT_590799 [Russula brevipes]|nr:hypothetical protein BC826DRAFT_590799 [Russula brevipes]